MPKHFYELAQDRDKAEPLGPKCQRLIKLGIAVGIGSKGVVLSHDTQALDEGITPDEIRHVILQSLTTAGFPKMIVAIRWAKQIIHR